MRTLAERIREVRGTLSRKEFADSLFIHVNTLGRYERGEGEPDATVISKLCDIFDVDPGWLILGKGKGPTSSPPSYYQGEDGKKLYFKDKKDDNLDRNDLDNLVLINKVVSNLLEQMDVPLKEEVIPMVSGVYYNDIKARLAFLAEDLIKSHTENAHVKTEKERTKRGLTDINQLSSKKNDLTN